MSLICSYMIQMAVADYSGQAWLSGFNDVGLIVFGMTANELHDIKVGSNLYSFLMGDVDLTAICRSGTMQSTLPFCRRLLATPTTSRVEPSRTLSTYVLTTDLEGWAVADS